MKKLAYLLLSCGLVFGCGDDGSPPPPTDSGRSDSGGGTDSGGGMDSGGGGMDSGGGGMDSGDGTDGGDATDASGRDASGSDAGGGIDSGSMTDGSVPPDAASLRCDPLGADSCPGGTTCECCPLGGPATACICTTRCITDAMCPDSERPDCNAPPPPTAGMGICAPVGFLCRWGTICASPDTPIATPDGDRPIAELREGDLVYSVDGNQVRPVPIARVSRSPVEGHSVMRVALEGGAVLEISAGHPTADGRTFGELAAGQTLGELSILSVERVAYEHPFTYDILPASDTGDYFAAGARIGSTLTR